MSSSTFVRLAALCGPLHAVAHPSVTLAAQVPFTVSPASAAVIVDGATEQLDRITAPVISPDARILIAQPFDHHVRVYDTSGRLLWRFGREGDGPGEFRRMGPPGFLGAEVWVPDAVHSSITFIQDGRLRRTLPIPRQLRHGTIADHVVGASVLGVLPDGSLLVEATTPGNRRFPEGWAGRNPGGNELALVNVDTAGQVRRILGWVGEVRRCQPPADRALFPVPFCVPPLRAVSPNGGWLATIEGDRDPAGGFRLRITTADGRVTADRRIASPRHTVSRAAFDSLRQLFRTFRNKPPGFEEALARLRPPSHYPAARGILIADDGRVAVEVWDGEPHHLYRRFAADGSELAGLRLPANEVLAGLGPGYLLVVRSDEDEIYSLVRYVERW